MKTILVRGGYIRVKSEIKYYPDENSALPYAGAYLALTGEAAAHISCRNEMMQRAALCATLLLES
jgi:hypothetical protein